PRDAAGNRPRPRALGAARDDPGRSGEANGYSRQRRRSEDRDGGVADGVHRAGRRPARRRHGRPDHARDLDGQLPPRGRAHRGDVPGGRGPRGGHRRARVGGRGEPRHSTGAPFGRAADRRRGAPAQRRRVGRARHGLSDGPPADGRLRAHSVSATVDTGARRDTMDGFYRAVRAVGRFWLWFFFRSVDVRHPERVPANGPVLLCINHPNNFIDSLLVGGAIPRKVHYLATAALFRNRFVARFLLACGAIPVYRKQDDPSAVRMLPAAGAELTAPATTAERNAGTFEACFKAFAEGRLVAIYSEGTTQ